MDDDNKIGGADPDGGAQTSRARNRTVMLTPEITGEVRARLAQDMASDVAAGADVSKNIGSEVSFSPRPSGASPTASFGAAAPSTGMGASSLGGGFEPVARAPQPQMKVAAEPTTPSPYRVRQGVIWSKPSTVTGFLVSYDEDEHGEVFELRMGRLIVTSEAPGAGNFLVLDSDTVSSMHAIIRMAKFGEIQILDQLSEHGTRILRAGTGKEEDLSGDKSTLHHGDIVFFGDRKFCVCLIPQVEE